MNDFFEQIWLDNSVKEYFIVAGVILFVLLLRRYISRYFAGLLFLIVHKIWKNVDKGSFKNLVAKPLGFFLLVLISIIALHKLAFPSLLNVEVYKFTVKDIIHCVGTIVLVISFINLLVRIIDFVAIIL